MRNKIKALAFLTLLAKPAFADPQTLIIAGGANPKSVGIRYLNISKHAYDTGKIFGQSPEVAALDGQWKFADKGKMHPAMEDKDIENAIKSMVKKLKPGEPFNFFINDHGYGPNSERKPENSGFYLYNPESNWDKNPSYDVPKMSHEKFLEMINKLVPKETPVRIIGIHCFSGGLHSIAFSRPNTCTSASTDFRTPTYSEEKFNLYGKSFWEEFYRKDFDLDHDNKTSLFEAHMGGFTHDDNNESRADVSSFAYVDSILKEGPYVEQDSWLKRVFDDPSEVAVPNFNYLVCSLLPNFDEEIKKLKGVADILDKIAPTQQMPKDSEKVMQQIPTASKNLFKLAIEDYQANHEKYQKILSDLRDAISEFRRNWEAVEEKQKDGKRAEFTTAFAKLDMQYRQEMGKFIPTYYLMNKMKKVERFLNIATPDQKKKFTELMQCESAPLF